MTDTYVSPILAAQDKIDNLNDLVKSLQYENDALRGQSETATKMSNFRLDTINTLAARINKAEKLLNLLVDDGVIEEDTFVEIASVFEWETTKEVEVTVTAVFKGTITVPRGFETDYLDEQMNVECNLGNEIDGYLDCDEISVEVQK